jgi:hypothetical protein
MRCLKTLRVVRLAAIYFGVIFGTGFLLGPLRVMFLEPRVGARLAELLEMPFVLAVSILAALRLIRVTGFNMTPLQCLASGFLAGSGILAADVLVGVFLRGMTLAEIFLHRDPYSGTAYYLSLSLCVALPWALRRVANDQ